MRRQKLNHIFFKRGETHYVKDKWTDPVPSFTSSNVRARGRDTGVEIVAGD